jgi:hypothetical protein
MPDELVKINDKDFHIVIFELTDLTKKIIELYSNRLIESAKEGPVKVMEYTTEKTEKIMQSKTEKKKKRKYNYWTTKDDVLIKEKISENPEITPTAMQIYFPGRTVSSIHHHIKYLKYKNILKSDSKKNNIVEEKNLGRAPNNTALFLNWVKDQDIFSLNDVIAGNPSFDHEKAFELVDYQVKIGFLEKVSSNTYRKIKK